MSKLRDLCTKLWTFFTPYEKWWFFTIVFLSVVISFYYPPDPVNGVSGQIIGILYLTNVFCNALCELLLAKQSKWNFLVSLVVELTEIIIPIVLAFRFATMAVTLLFWIPVDIVSFINWHKHKDNLEEKLTQVRKLSGWGEVAAISSIIIWTVVVGGFMSDLNIKTDLFGGNANMLIWSNYLDACVSAVGIANGLFILFRYREQWIAWYLSAALETALNIMAGQYVLLVLKAGYFTNTTYGYIKWTRYIRSQKCMPTDRDKTSDASAPADVTGAGLDL